MPLGEKKVRLYWFSTLGVLKSKFFWPKIEYTPSKWLHKKCQNRTFKVDFLRQKLTGFFH